jgi:hypothetical protein
MLDTVSVVVGLLTRDLSETLSRQLYIAADLACGELDLGSVPKTNHPPSLWPGGHSLLITWRSGPWTHRYIRLLFIPSSAFQPRASMDDLEKTQA